MVNETSDHCMVLLWHANSTKIHKYLILSWCPWIFIFFWVLVIQCMWIIYLSLGWFIGDAQLFTSIYASTYMHIFWGFLLEDHHQKTSSQSILLYLPNITPAYVIRTHALNVDRIADTSLYKREFQKVICLVSKICPHILTQVWGYFC